MSPTRYPSAVDGWFAALLVGVPLGLIVFGLWLLGRSTAEGLVQIGAGLFTGALIAALSWPCHYTLDEHTLTIRCGFLRESIPLARVRAVEPSHSLWSAPALSLKRVRITLDWGFRLVSPRQRDEFITELRRRSRLI